MATVVALLLTLTPAGAAALPAHHLPAGGFTNPGYVDGGRPSILSGLGFLAGRVVRALRPLGRAAASVDDSAAMFQRWTADQNAPTVTWIGHSSLLVRQGGVYFLTDPMWSEYASPIKLGPRRLQPPGMPLAELPDIAFVVISHNHYDHLDLPTLRVLSERGSIFVVPLGNAALLREEGIGPLLELDWWQSVKVDGLEITCVPARHWSRRGLLDRNRALWSGWTVKSEDRLFYFAGDTAPFGVFDEIRSRLGSPTLAALPVGAYLPIEIMSLSHMNPEQAIDAAVSLGASKTVAIHFGTFDLAEEELDEPPRRFRAASIQAARGAEVDWVLKVGETRGW